MWIQQFRHGRQLSLLLCDPRVPAISELGVDHSAPKNTWVKQEQLLAHILQVGVAGRVLVIHVRGEPTDPFAEIVNARVRKVLRQHCKHHHAAHPAALLLHDSGSASVLIFAEYQIKGGYLQTIIKYYRWYSRSREYHFIRHEWNTIQVPISLWLLRLIRSCLLFFFSPISSRNGQTYER